MTCKGIQESLTKRKLNLLICSALYCLQGHLFILQILLCPALKLIYNIGSKHCKKPTIQKEFICKKFFYQYVPGRRNVIFQHHLAGTARLLFLFIMKNFMCLECFCFTVVCSPLKLTWFKCLV